MTGEEQEKLAHAFDELYELAERDCWGDPEMGQEHRCSCEPCIARRARDKIREAIDPAHVSLQERRLLSPPERVFLEKWREDNVRHQAINSGFSTLEWILCPDGEKRPGLVSHRDAQVAASVIQWLGTNCGQGFIWECERRIRAMDANFRGLRALDGHPNRDYSHAPKGVLDGAFEEAAAYVAGQFIPITEIRYPYLKSAILKCMKTAEKRAETAMHVAGAGI